MPLAGLLCSVFHWKVTAALQVSPSPSAVEKVTAVLQISPSPSRGYDGGSTGSLVSKKFQHHRCCQLWGERRVRYASE